MHSTSQITPSQQKKKKKKTQNLEHVYIFVIFINDEWSGTILNDYYPQTHTTFGKGCFEIL